MNQLLEALAETELLRDASNALLEKVLAHASPVQLEPGELLLSPERHNAHIYLLLEGTLLRVVPVDAKREEGMGLRLGGVGEARQAKPGTHPGHQKFSVHGIHAQSENGHWLKGSDETLAKSVLSVAVLN